MNENAGASAEIAYELSAEGFRMTTLRRAILAIVAEEMKPFSTHEIRASLTREKVSFHLASLYRELDVLTEANVIHPVYFHDHIKRYEYVQHEHHHHLVCVKCNVIADVDAADNFDDLERRLEKKTKFTILRHSLEFFGLCKNCS